MEFKRDTSLEMYSLVGPVIYEQSNSDMEKMGFTVPAKCYFFNIDENDYEFGDYMEEYEEFVVNGSERNKIAQRICDKHSFNHKILIITRRVAHAKILGEMIKNSVVITGQTANIHRKQDFQKFKDEDNLVLIGSAQIFAQGINIKKIDIIINMSGNKSDIQTIQILGRCLRKSEGKKFGYYFDINDKSKFLSKASNDRKKILREHGHRVEMIDAKYLEEVKIE